MFALLALVGCAEPGPLQVEAVSTGASVTVSADAEGMQVSLLDPAGVPLVRATAVEGSRSVTLALPPGLSGELTVRAKTADRSGEARVELGDRDALAVALSAPLGAESRPVATGARLPLSLLPDAEAPAALRVRAPRDQAVEVRVDGVAIGAVAAGSTELLSFRVTDDVELSVWPAAPPAVAVAEGAAIASVAPLTVATVDVRHLSEAEAAAAVELGELRFPALDNGDVDIVRERGSISLPSAWWRRVLEQSSLGVRARDTWLPWAWLAVPLRNTGPDALDLVVRARVVGPDGEPDRSFRPRLRAADDGTGNTSVLVRVPPGGEALATLPVFVDEDMLGPGPFTQVVEVLAIGREAPLQRVDVPLPVSRSSSVVAAGLAITLVTSFAGLALIALRTRQWLREFDTAALVTLALFASLSFVAGTVGLLVGLGFAAAAGPFATMVTGFVDDALQAVLVGTLVTLLPRPGAATLMVIVAWLLRGVATGSLSPLDLAFVSCRVATLEGGLWLAGLTRGGAWRNDPRWKRVLRLGAGLSIGSLAGTAASLVLHAALFRLYFADWYVIMVLAGPGFTYVMFASGVADRVAQQLRRVED